MISSQKVQEILKELLIEEWGGSRQSASLLKHQKTGNTRKLQARSCPEKKKLRNHGNRALEESELQEGAVP